MGRTGWRIFWITLLASIAVSAAVDIMLVYSYCAAEGAAARETLKRFCAVNRCEGLTYE